MPNINTIKKFSDVSSENIIGVHVRYPLVVLDTRKGRYVVAVTTPSGRRALSQMLKLMGIKYREFVALMKKDPEKAKTLLVDNMRRDLVISGVLSSDGTVYVAYRVTTPEFISVPHRILFDFVEGLLSDAGVSVLRKKPLRFGRRYGMAYILGEDRIPLKFATVYSYGLAVTNSNVGVKAVHIYGYFEFSGCSNSIMIPSVHVVHKGTLESVLMRVKNAVEEVLARIRDEYVPQLNTAVKRLAEIPVSEDVIRTWLDLVAKRYGKKYARYLENMVKKYTRMYGYNKYALLQAVTDVSTRAKAETVKEYLNREAVKLIAEAVGARYESRGM